MIESITESKARGRTSARLSNRIRSMGPPAGRLWHNGRNDSLPFTVFAALLALTQWHRHTLTPSQYGSEVYGLYGWIVVPSIIIFFIALLKASKAFILGTTAGLAAVGSWMAYATMSGITLKTIIIGLVLTSVLGIPYWITRVDKEIERTKAVGSSGKSADVKIEHEFDKVAWLRGGEWLTDPIRNATGYTRELLLPPGVSAPAFVSQRVEGMANLLRVDPEDVELVERGGHKVEVFVHKENVLLNAQSWPLVNADRTNIMDAIPVGVRRTGEIVAVRLPERHLLVGGTPGSGKSGLAQMLVAAGALDPRCELWLFDGKLIELAPWKGSATVYVGDKNADANAALRKLQAEMTSRYEIMGQLGKRKFSDTGGRVGPLLVVIDELARYLRDGTTKDIAEFRSRLGDVLDRGRAAGIIVVALTQQPDAEMLGPLRRSFTYRVALRVVESSHSKMILGTSFPDASRLSEDLPGMAYLGTSGTPRQIRTFFLEDDEITALVARAFQADERELDDEIIIDDYPELEAAPPHEETSTVTTIFVANEEEESDSFPDGSRVPAHRLALWNALGREPKSADALARDVGLTANPVREALRRWVALGHVEVEAGKPPVGDRYFKE